MKEVQKITYKAILLFVDILVLAYQVVKKIILPNRHRKGNILFSLLTFFVGLIEKLQFFEKNILQKPVVFKHRYIKHGLILTASFLFLLSSIEWTVDSRSPSPINQNQATFVYGKTPGTFTIWKEQHIVNLEQVTLNHFNTKPHISFDTPLPESEGRYFVRRYLHFCTFRI